MNKKAYTESLYASLEQLVQSSSQMIVYLATDFNIMHCNPAFENFHAWDRTAIVCKNYFKLCEQSAYAPLITEASLIRGELETDEEYQILVDGIEHYANWNIQTVTPPAGEKYYLIIGEDLTQQKMTERDLEYNIQERRKNKIYLDNIMMRVPGSIYWKDLDGKFLGCNNYVAKMAGLTKPSQIVGKSDSSLPWSYQASTIRQVDDEIIKYGVTKTLEETVPLADGTNIVMLSNKAPLRDEDGNIIGMIGNSLDITKLKQLEEALRIEKEQAEKSNKAKSEFIACLSHDFRTPLNGVIGMAEVLRFRQHYSDQEEFIDGIAEAGKVLLNLVEDILSYSKLETGKLDLRAEEFDLLSLVENVVHMMAHKANSKGLKLIISYSDQIPRFVISDQHVIQRILSNLIGNAIKFTQRGYVYVCVESEMLENDQARLQISVEDSGIGIESAQIEQVFEKFYRVEESYRGNYQGTGLGLSIVKQLVQSLDGKVGVNSQLGKGSTFWCSLPFKLRKVNRTTSNWHTYYSDVRILIVDDLELRGRALQTQLSSNNTKVVNGIDAYAELQKSLDDKKPYQIVLIDDEISGRNALRLASTIKARSELSKALLILMGNPRSLDAAEKARDAGFYKELIKPVKPTELTEALLETWQAWVEKLIDPSYKLTMLYPKILLVEDNKIAQLTAKAILEDLGCLVDIAETGQDALKLASHGYHLIFMDIGLPDKDGLSITRQLRLREKYRYSTPIVALTAHVSEVDVQRCEDAGMNGFISKPATRKDFQKMLLEHISFYQEAAVESQC